MRTTKPSAGVEFATFTEEEAAAVETIVVRAMALSWTPGHQPTPLDIRMDLSAVHAKVPLRLADLAAADRLNFAHDIGGIRRHLNRETGELEDHFRPRFAIPAAEWKGVTV